MPLFRYQALNARGELLEGQLEAASAAELAARLQEQGHLPVQVVLAGTGTGLTSWRSLLRPAPFAGERLVRFTQQLATLLAAGQPLDRALGILMAQPDEPAARRIIADVRDAVREGASLSAALERQHGAFSRLYVNMVRAGEAGGSLAPTLQRLADYLERVHRLRARVINALVYPAILLVMVGLSLLFLLGYVVPQFAAMYDSLGADLPWFSRTVLTVGQWVRAGWIVLLALPLLAVLTVERLRRDPVFLQRLDGWLLARPRLGALLARLETARLARTLGTLLGNGVPLITALGIARNVLSNRVLAAQLETVIDEVKNGLSLAAALARTKGFPALAIQMIQVGEESGQLEAMLLKAADVFEQDTQASIERLLAALVPAVTLLLALVIGAVILSVLAPIYDLTNAVG
ncbi:MAG: type II secretion system F family protein [Thermomonas hydrothermalis]|uniref:type II secretion system protein XpsF n=1 Tax=Thermomonas hydrothermalis TaxID=213588 RepID=UPI0023535242|nr:type II secretion system F family protein [Thermomonas hydrothermalis]MCL6619512.1 type II secretion system F family protein [Thermomonas hydrothermalis]